MVLYGVYKCQERVVGHETRFTFFGVFRGISEVDQGQDTYRILRRGVGCDHQDEKTQNEKFHH